MPCLLYPGAEYLELLQSFARSTHEKSQLLNLSDSNLAQMSSEIRASLPGDSKGHERSSNPNRARLLLIHRSSSTNRLLSACLSRHKQAVMLQLAPATCFLACAPYPEDILESPFSVTFQKLINCLKVALRTGSPCRFMPDVHLFLWQARAFWRGFESSVSECGQPVFPDQPALHQPRNHFLRHTQGPQAGPWPGPLASPQHGSGQLLGGLLPRRQSCGAPAESAFCFLGVGVRALEDYAGSQGGRRYHLGDYCLQAY